MPQYSSTIAAILARVFPGTPPIGASASPHATHHFRRRSQISLRFVVHRMEHVKPFFITVEQQRRET
jgi:hypothetical protein